LFTRRTTIVEYDKRGVVKPRRRGNTRDGPAFRSEDPFNRELALACLRRCDGRATRQQNETYQQDPSETEE
jgi:hypothetical protein